MNRLALFFFAAGHLLLQAQGQCDLQVLSPSQPQFDFQFGEAIRVCGSVGVVGMPWDDVQGYRSGAVEIYRSGAGGWQLEQTLRLDPDPGGAPVDFRFGSSLDCDGDRIVVGAPFEQHLAFNTAAGEAIPGDLHGVFHGDVHVYRHNGLWEPETVQLPSDLSAGDLLGWTCAIDGDVMVAGAMRQEEGAVLGAGAVYVFERHGSIWRVAQRLVDPEPSSYGEFGKFLALDGDVLMVSGEPTFSLDRVHVFARGPSGWARTQTLEHPVTGRPYKHFFGAAIDVDGDWAVVGAHQEDAGGELRAGTVRVYESLPSGWALCQLIVAPDPAISAAFGASVDLDGDRLAIGAAWGESASGGAYVFQRVGAEFEFQERLRAPASMPSLFFGARMALSGDQLWIHGGGDQSSSADSGLIYAQRLIPGLASYCHCADFAPCGNVDPLAGCDHSGTGGTRLSACGSASVGADDLQLSANNLPVAVPCMLLLGDGTSFLPMGGGQQCVAHLGSAPLMFPASQSSAQGTWTGPAGLIGQAQQQFGAGGTPVAGSTWHLQLYYGSPSGSCGLGSNLSQALAVTFAP